MDQLPNILIAAFFVLVLAAFTLAFGRPRHMRTRPRSRLLQ